MQIDLPKRTGRPKLSVALRFWLLLGVILSLALACSGVAVRVVALPFLNDYQQQAVVEQANKVVNELEANLAKDRMLMQFVASDPNVVNIALGYVDATTYMTDRLNALPKKDELSWVTLYDAFGEPIAVTISALKSAPIFPNRTLPHSYPRGSRTPPSRANRYCSSRKARRPFL